MALRPDDEESAGHLPYLGFAPGDAGRCSADRVLGKGGGALSSSAAGERRVIACRAEADREGRWFPETGSDPRTGASQERRRSDRSVAGFRSGVRNMPFRYGGLYAVRLVNASGVGACVESDRVFRFGPGFLAVRHGDRNLSRLADASRLQFAVRLVWSQLVKTHPGPFGEVCPSFCHGLEVAEASRDDWVQMLSGVPVVEPVETPTAGPTEVPAQELV